MWEVTGTIDEDSFFDDHVAGIIASEEPGLPPHEQSLGETAVRWDRVGPDSAFIQAQGGTVDDRVLARQMVAAQLEPYSIKEAEQTFDSMQRTADWNDIMSKARRLIQQGRVRILRNGYQNVVAQVLGDGTDNNGKPDSHQAEIFRNDPNSRAITYSDCDCGWGEFQNQPRTREFKRYQDRPCAHILAAYWQALATPLDEDLAMQQAQDPQGQLFQGTPGGTGANPNQGIMQQTQAPQGPQGAPAPSQGDQMSLMQPSPADVLPQWENPQEQPDVQPQNPASVPGLRGPTPTNPINYPPGPGGTFSSWRKADWEVRQDVNTFTPRTMQDLGWRTAKEAMNVMAPEGETCTCMLGNHPSQATTGERMCPVHGDAMQQAAWNLRIKKPSVPLPEPNTIFLKRPPLQWPETPSAGLQGAGRPNRFGSDQPVPEMADRDPRLTTPLVNGQMVQLRYPDEGRLQGRFENWTEPGIEGDPRRTQLPAGLVGEVLGTDPATGFVSVLYMGKPWDENKAMQPFGATGEHLRSWLIHRPDVKRPGPAYRRTR